MEQRIIAIVFCFLLLQFSPTLSSTVCIIDRGIDGASVAHFLRQYSTAYHPSQPPIAQINMFERNGVVGGRMATVTMAGETFEAGTFILHPKNYHAVNYTKYLDLQLKKPKSSDDSLSWVSGMAINLSIKHSTRSQSYQLFNAWCHLQIRL